MSKLNREIERVMSEVSVVSFKSYPESVAKAFDQIGAAAILGRQKRVMIKPNLVDVIPYPVTTPVECTSAIIDYVRRAGSAEIVIAEGSGGEKPTGEVFASLGYSELAAEKQVRLIDLNEQPLIKSEIPSCKIFSSYYLPRLAMEYFIISVPMLKAHTLSTVTLSLKNMMGFAPPSHYQMGGFWKKSFFHNRIDESIIEMNMHRMPDLTLIDATIGMPEYHLGGSHCDPPVNKIVASFNAVEADRVGARLLGFDWKEIGHLAEEIVCASPQRGREC